MSKIYTSADQLIGKTPLMELTHIEKEHGLKAKILAKLEYFNPAGSVKDRVAKAMIDEAEKKRKIKERFCYYRTDEREYRNRSCGCCSGKRIPHYYSDAGNDVGRTQADHESIWRGTRVK